MWWTFDYAGIQGIAGTWLEQWYPVLGLIVGFLLLAMWVPMLISVIKAVVGGGGGGVSWGSYGSSSAFNGSVRGALGRMDFSPAAEKTANDWHGQAMSTGIFNDDPALYAVYQDLDYYQSSDADFEELADVYHGLDEVRDTDADAPSKEA
ncbi:hypothetical protein CCP3SC15_1240015 [Gammaproteobacteria bacterium]